MVVIKIPSMPKEESDKLIDKTGIRLTRILAKQIKKNKTDFLRMVGIDLELEVLYKMAKLSDDEIMRMAIRKWWKLKHNELIADFVDGSELTPQKYIEWRWYDKMFDAYDKRCAELVEKCENLNHSLSDKIFVEVQIDTN